MKNKISAPLFLYLLLAAMQISSSNAQVPKEQFVINGYINDIKDSTLIELIDIKTQVRVASAYTKSGIFILNGSVKSPTGCWLTAGDEYAILQVENLPMDFRSPQKNMRWESITSGGYEQQLQNELNDLQRPYQQIGSVNANLLRDSLEIQEPRRSNIKKVIEEANENADNIYAEFGKTHCNSYMGLNILYRKREEIGKPVINVLYKKISDKLKNTPEGKGLKIFIHERLAEVGKPMIDFKVRTFDGNFFKLSEIKGKYIYLSFGEAGCYPCRLENKVIKDNFDRLKSKISFVNFSLDKTRQAWELSTKHDAITWINVSDLDSKIEKIKNLYAVQAMPTSFLIDSNGIIVEKFIGFRADFIDVIENLTK